MGNSLPEPGRSITPHKDTPPGQTLAAPALFKLVSLAMLVVVAWPLPVMLAHNSPDGNILGLYDTVYFVLLTVYLIAAIGWGIFTAWTFARLDEAQYNSVQAFVSRHVALIVTGFSLSLAGVLALQFLIRSQIIGLPSEVFWILRYVPAVIAVLLSILAGLMLANIGRRRAEWLKGHRMLASLYYHRYDLAMGLLVVLFVGLTVFAEGLLVHPLAKDSGAHMYIGQRLLAGDIPYRDVLYFHPPLRFAVSSLWAAAAKLTGLPPVETARVLNLVLVIPWLVILFHVTRNLTGERLAGLLAALLAVQTGILFDLFGVNGPNMKVEIGLAIITGVWAAQHKRWGWAGVVSGCAAMMWLPAGISTTGLLIAALLTEKPLNVRAALRLSLGAGAVIATLAGWLVAAGGLVAAFRQTILAAFAITNTLADGSKLYLEASINAVGGWVIATLMLLGLVYLLVFQLPRQWRQPATTAFILGTLPLVVIMYSKDVVASGDLAIVLALVAVPGGVCIDWLIRNGLAGHRSVAGWTTTVVVCLMVVEIAHLAYIDSFSLPAVNTLSEQRTKAVAIDRVIGVGDRVQCFDEQWLTVMTWRENALPVIQIRPKGMVSNTLAGWSADRIVQGLEQQQPDIIIVGPGPDPTVEAYVWEHYIPVGPLEGSSVGYTAYTHQDYKQIDEIKAIWADN